MHFHAGAQRGFSALLAGVRVGVVSSTDVNFIFPFRSKPRRLWQSAVLYMPQCPSFDRSHLDLEF